MELRPQKLPSTRHIHPGSLQARACAISFVQNLACTSSAGPEWQALPMRAAAHQLRKCTAIHALGRAAVVFAAQCSALGGERQLEQVAVRC